MVYDGIPHSLRPYIWMRLAGAMSKRASSEVSYKQIVRASANDHLMTSKQIEKDLLRTLTNNVCFASLKSTGIPRLRRILRGLAWLYPDIGYCQVPQGDCPLMTLIPALCIVLQTPPFP